MKLLSIIGVVVAVSGGRSFAASALTPIDLSAYQGRSHLEFSGGGWALPLGEHVMGGIPWKVDGMIELFGHGPARFGACNGSTAAA